MNPAESAADHLRVLGRQAVHGFLSDFVPSWAAGLLCQAHRLCLGLADHPKLWQACPRALFTVTSSGVAVSDVMARNTAMAVKSSTAPVVEVIKKNNDANNKDGSDVRDDDEVHESAHVPMR